MSKKDTKNSAPEKTDMGIYVALDLGSTEIRGIAAKKDENGNFVTVATATFSSTGMKNGAILNVEKAKYEIQHVLTDLESIIKRKANEGIEDPAQCVNVRIDNIYVALNGKSIKTLTNKAQARLTKEFVDQELLDEFDSQNLSLAKKGQKILDVHPVNFLVDDEETNSPVGCSASVISATYKIVLGDENLLSNLNKCISELGRNLAGYCLAPIAASNATVSGNEKELGVVVVDFGHTTTGVSVFHKNKLHYTYVIPLGSDLITKDIQELRILEAEAERIKKKGNCNLDRNLPDLNICLSNGSIVTYRAICEVIERRVDQILGYTKDVVNKSQLRVGPQLDQVVMLGNASELLGLKAKIENQLGLMAHKGTLLDRYKHLVPADKASSFHVAIGTLLTATQNCVFSTLANEVQKEQPKQQKKSSWLKGAMNGVINFATNMVTSELPEHNQKD